MSKRIVGLAVGLVVVTVGLVGHQTTAKTSARQVDWYTYKDGTDQARRQNKNLVIYFHAEWCTYCGKMEKETFADPAVVDFLNNNAIAVKVDVDREKRIARQFGVRGLPATFLLLTNGRQIGPMPGFIPPRNYLAMLSKIFSKS